MCTGVSRQAGRKSDPPPAAMPQFQHQAGMLSGKVLANSLEGEFDPPPASVLWRPASIWVDGQDCLESGPSGGGAMHPLPLAWPSICVQAEGVPGFPFGDQGDVMSGSAFMVQGDVHASGLVVPGAQRAWACLAMVGPGLLFCLWEPGW